MVTRNDSLWKTLDWVTIFIYLLLIVGGWFSVCGASYDYGERDFLDFSPDLLHWSLLRLLPE